MKDQILAQFDKPLLVMFLECVKILECAKSNRNASQEEK